MPGRAQAPKRSATVALIAGLAAAVCRVRWPWEVRTSPRKQRSPLPGGITTPTYEPFPGAALPARERRRDLHRHPAQGPPRALWRLPGDGGRVAPRPRGRAVRARGLARSLDPPVPRLDLHGPLPSAPRRARQRRLRVAAGLGHSRPAAPRSRLRDGRVRGLLRPGLALGDRPGPRDLRRFLRLLRPREPQPHRGRAVGGAGDGPRPRLAREEGPRLASLLSLGTPLRSPRALCPSRGVPPTGAHGLRRRGALRRRPGRASARGPRGPRPASTHPRGLSRGPRRGPRRPRRDDAQHLRVRLHPRRAPDHRPTSRSQARGLGTGSRRPPGAGPGAARRRHADGARPRRVARADGARRHESSAARGPRGGFAARPNDGRRADDREQSPPVAGRPRRPRLVRRELLPPLPPRVERAPRRGDAALEVDPRAAARALRPLQGPAGARQRLRPKPAGGGHPGRAARGDGLCEGRPGAEAGRHRPRGPRAVARPGLRGRERRQRQPGGAQQGAAAGSEGPAAPAARAAEGPIPARRGTAGGRGAPARGAGAQGPRQPGGALHPRVGTLPPQGLRCVDRGRAPCARAQPALRRGGARSRLRLQGRGPPRRSEGRLRARPRPRPRQPQGAPRPSARSTMPSGNGGRPSTTTSAPRPSLPISRWCISTAAPSPWR